MARPPRHTLRNFVILLAVALVAVGFWRSWFVVSAHDSPESQKVDINLKVDTAKIKEDTKRATEKTKEEAEKISTKVKAEAQKLRESK